MRPHQLQCCRPHVPPPSEQRPALFASTSKRPNFVNVAATAACRLAWESYEAIVATCRLGLSLWVRNVLDSVA